MRVFTSITQSCSASSKGCLHLVQFGVLRKIEVGFQAVMLEAAGCHVCLATNMPSLDPVAVTTTQVQVDHRTTGYPVQPNHLVPGWFRLDPSGNAGTSAKLNPMASVGL